MNDIIKTSNLTKTFKKTCAVNEINLRVGRGEVYGFIGCNGAGKTTTIKMLLGLIAPTSGDIEIFGKSLKHNKSEILKSIGSIVEHPGFYPNLTAEENLKINTKIMGIHKHSIIDEVLDLVSLTDDKHRLFSAFSIGMKQRLGLARALLNNPQLLILDEPTSGLDPQGIIDMRKLIKKLSTEKGITVLLSSHILSEIEQIVDRIGIIHKGKIIEEITKQELHEKSRIHLRTIVNNPAKAIKTLECKLGIFDYRLTDNHQLEIYSHLNQSSQIIKAFVMSEIDVISFYEYKERLEDYFLRTIGGDHDVA